MLRKMIVALALATLVSSGESRPGAALVVRSATVDRVFLRDYFIENVGQLRDRSIRYYVQSTDMLVGFGDGQIRFEGFTGIQREGLNGEPIPQQVLETKLVELTIGKGDAGVKAVEQSPGYSNYYGGSNAAQWYTDIPHYRRLTYKNVYPGIDLDYFFDDQGQLTFEYHVGHGADPGHIGMRYTGIRGLELGDGVAAVRTPPGLPVHGRPLTYQERGKDHETVASAFAANLPQNLDSSRKLVIDPTLGFSTYWGTGGGVNRTVAIDGAGNIYMSGGAIRKDWPTTDGSSNHGHFDVTVAKFDPNGRLLWSTILGGPDEDYAYVSAVSANGELYVSGRAGDGFPTTPGAFDRTFRGGKGGGPHKPTDAFVVKLSREGKLVYSTYIGGNGDEAGRAIHLLPSGRLIVGGGNTTATDMPTDKGTLGGPVLKPKLGGIKDSWVALVAADGKSLDFLTYFGPSDDRDLNGDETIRALGVDATGNIWVGGTTQGTDMVPTPDAFQKVRGGAGRPWHLRYLPFNLSAVSSHTSEAYVAKLSSDGKKLVYFSWLGGNGNDEIETEGVSDAAGNFYVGGSTGSSNFPTTPGAFQSILKGGEGGRFADAWVAKINNDGGLGFATLYGGTAKGPESFFGPVVDRAGNVYCTGRFRSNDVPVTRNAFQSKLAGGQDAVLAVFSPDGKRLLYGSYFGGSGNDVGRHIGIHPNGSAVYIIGETGSKDLPLVNAPQTAQSGIFLAGFTLGPP